MPVKAGYLALAGGGGILVWASLKNKKPSQVLRSLLSGNLPSDSSGDGSNTTNPITGATTSTPNSAVVLSYQAYALGQLTIRGWAGQWSAFNNIVMSESSWNNTARNPVSGAFGIAQALDHGDANTSGTYGNNYGNFGTSDAVCKLANDGNGDAQINWMINYIGIRYGNPDNAWTYHQENGSY